MSVPSPPKFAVILPAAGRSTRFQGPARKKVFAELQGRPVWLRSVEAFVNRDDVAQVLVVVSPDDADWFRDKFRPNFAFLDVELVLGGAERADSVQNALSRVRSDIDFIAVHDAARPVIAPEWIGRVFQAAAQHGAALLATPVTSTLKRVDASHQIVETVSREALWAAQTPQVARKDWLLDAFARRAGFVATDEAQLLERAGYPVHIVEGSPLNLKITTADDLRIAEAFLDLLPKPKGLRSLHPFADEDPRWA
jgi:2-C-methyl-D-erythritol 4-phosphate cytidylyltransferase